jgi:universal stress protein E
MPHEAKVKKALVVLSPDLIRTDEPVESTLIRRAISLAKITGCELELFHACFDGSLEDGLLASNDFLQRERERVTDSDATKMAEMATRLKNEGVNVIHEVRWDYPRTDAILRKIAQATPDIVLKQSREHNYLLGVTTNTDWDLARRSPAHVWFVNDAVQDIDRIVAAIGNKFGDAADVTTAADFELLQVAGILGDTFKAAIYPVNAFQIPDARVYTAGMAGTVAPVEPPNERKMTRTKVVKEHESAVRALAQYFDIETDNVHVCEGHPSDVIPDVADSINADMIVMGAKSISRLERLVSSVTVEPVMSDTKCDILVIRERDVSTVPNVADNPVYGVPKYDLEHAITNPKETFESPQQIANLTDISIELRYRILQAWELDIRADMRAANEGGPVADTDYETLDEILSAKSKLKTKREKSAGNGRSTVEQMSA